MIVVFGQDGNNAAAFTALLAGGGIKDLGVAFVYLTAEVLPCVSVAMQHGSSKLAINYKSGPEGKQ